MQGLQLELNTTTPAAYPLLGKHKPSAEWYTPPHIWERVYKVLGKDIFDPCPIKGENGLEAEWGGKKLYINPPTPAAKWAEKAIQTVNENHDTSILFAAFSESVLFQVPTLQCFPHVKVRHRIKWLSPKGESDKPRNYNTFVILTHDSAIVHRFGEYFKDLGCYGILNLL